MKPFVLKGHERPINAIRFNYDGDLFFSACAQGKINLWQAYTGERIGSFKNRSAVKSIDVDINTQYMETIKQLEDDNVKLKISHEKNVQLLIQEIQKLKANAKDVSITGNANKKNRQPQTKASILPNSENDKKQLNDKLKKIESRNNELQHELTVLRLQLDNSKRTTKSTLKKSQQTNKQKSHEKAEQAQKLSRLQDEVGKLRNQNSQLKQKLETSQKSCQRQGQQVNRICIEKQSQISVKQEGLFVQVQRLRELLLLTDVQYKNLLHKQQLQEQQVRSKNEELNLMTQELIELQKQVKKLSQEDQKLKRKYIQEQRLRQETEQENSLLKEMIKGHKTMLKIKENQIARLKDK